MSGPWQVVWHPQTAGDLKRLGRAAAERVRSAVTRRLALDPYGGKRLKTSSGRPLWRFRAGDYRVIYTVTPQAVYILVLRVGHRSEVYRRIEELPQE